MLYFSQLAEYTVTFIYHWLSNLAWILALLLKKKILEPPDKSNTKSVVYDTYKWFK